MHTRYFRIWHLHRTVVFTNILKLLVGRPRPHFAAVCQAYVTGSTTTCIGDAREVAEARKSFPSGHSSLAFSAAIYLCAYLAPVVRIGAPSHGEAKAWRILVLLAPPLMAALVAVSRTIDYHHHFADILAGSLIGTGIASLVAYNRIGDINPARESDMLQSALPVVSQQYDALEESPMP
jgi:membrane-associated phospholipid phosphatase